MEFDQLSSIRWKVTLEVPSVHAQVTRQWQLKMEVCYLSAAFDVILNQHGSKESFYLLLSSSRSVLSHPTLTYGGTGVHVGK